MYILVIVTVYPTCAIGLIKYQQIISKALTKFKGLAWLTYGEQIRCCIAYILSKAWDKADQLWTVTFPDLAKPHCSVCSSLYHQVEDCPNKDPSSKPHCQGLVCFDYKKPSGCHCCSCHFQYTSLFTIARTAAQATMPSLTALVQNSAEAATDKPTPVIAVRNKVEQC